MARSYRADYAFVDGRLRRDVLVLVGSDGRIEAVQSGDEATAAAPEDSGELEFGRRRCTRLRGRALLPGFVNAHSHSFQRLLRGRVEERLPDRPDGDFWLWRESMYHLVRSLSPEDIEVVARFAFVEMALSGFTHVVEFHYLHHQADGTPYEDRAETARRVMEAADFAGLGITLLRTGYQRAGFGRPPEPSQRRFVDPDPEAFEAGLEATLLAADDSGRRPVRVGLAAHSVRALDRARLTHLAELARSRDLVLHAHVAEQPRETDECLAETGLRPLELLDEVGALGERFTAVHATHLAPHEPALLGRAGAMACICPTTERNLGDGLPDLRSLHEAGVRLAVGTDSHARIDPFAEVRMLEEGERLRSMRRTVLAPAEGGSATPLLLRAGSEGGARAAGLSDFGLKVGARADLVSIDLDDPALVGVQDDEHEGRALLEAILLGGHRGLVRDVWVGGRHLVEDGVHLRLEQAAREFSELARRLFT